MTSVLTRLSPSWTNDQFEMGCHRFLIPVQYVNAPSQMNALSAMTSLFAYLQERKCASKAYPREAFFRVDTRIQGDNGGIACIRSARGSGGYLSAGPRSLRP